MKAKRQAYELALKTEKERAKAAGESPGEIEKDPELLAAESDLDKKKVDLSNAKLKVNKIKAQKTLNRIGFVSARVAITLSTGLATRVGMRVSKGIVQSGQAILQDTLSPAAKLAAGKGVVHETSLSKKKYLDKAVDKAVSKGLKHMNLKTRIKVAKKEFAEASDSKTKKKLGAKVAGLVVGDIALRISGNLLLRGGRVGYSLGRSTAMVGWTIGKELYKTPKDLVKEFSRDTATAERTAASPKLKKKLKLRKGKKVKEGGKRLI